MGIIGVLLLSALILSFLEGLKGISMIITPIFFVVWFVMKICKKPAKKWGVAALVGLVCFAISLFVTQKFAVCEHEYELVESKAATCEEDGYEKYHCALCDEDKTEDLKKLGHDMVDDHRTEPTEDADGEYVRKCSRCGYEETEKQKLTDADIVVDGETIYGFYDIMEEVGISKRDAENVTKAEDWRNGPRYKFSTEGTTARVYCNMDGTIYSVVIGANIPLYQQGYETWTIDNFVVPDLYRSELISLAKDTVNRCLNYPKTAKYPWFDWTVTRYFDMYTVSSTVEAQNAFGVPSEYGFTAKFYVSDDSARSVYLMLDGAVVLDVTDEYDLPEREEVDFEVEQPTDGSIRIYDGQLGEYGKKVQLDSYEYYWYMVPAGKYEAVSNVKTCTVYVDKNEITRNSDGYVEMENVSTYTWEYGETIIIEVGEDEHLFNVVGADYTLTLITD